MPGTARGHRRARPAHEHQQHRQRTWASSRRRGAVREREQCGGRRGSGHGRSLGRLRGGPANWRRAGIAGAAIGVVAAGAAAGVAIERLTVGRGMRRKARLALDSAGPYGALRGMPGKAVADDGTELYYEVDEVERRLHPRPAPPPALRPQGPGPRHRRLQPRLLPQPGLLALPAGRAARCRADRPLGPAQPRPLRAGRGPGPGRHAGHHRPARPRPEGRHRRGRARGPARARRPLDGRHDGDGPRRPVPRP